MSSTFFELVKSRRSVRKYTDQPVGREKIMQCIEAARFAPSAENLQPWRFVILDDRTLIQDFSGAAFSGIYRPTRWAAKAPVIIAMFAKMDVLVNRLGRMVQGSQYYLLDLGIAGEHLVLQAQELGIGTCWIGWFHARNTLKFFNLSSNYRAVALFSMGYFDQLPYKPRKMLSMDQIVLFNLDGKF